MHKRTLFLKVKLEENIYYDNSIRKYIFVVMLRIQKKARYKNIYYQSHFGITLLV